MHVNDNQYPVDIGQIPLNTLESNFYFIHKFAIYLISIDVQEVYVGKMSILYKQEMYAM